MSQYTAPQIEKDWVGIATNRDLVLAAVVSSYFQTAGSYFAGFDFPSIETSYSSAVDYGTDGPFAQGVGTRAAVWIINAIARIQPRGIVLLGLTEAEKSYLLPYLSSARVIEVNTIEEASQRFSPSRREPDSLACRSSEIIEGLLLAKFSGKYLVVAEDSQSLPKTHLHRGNGILVVESDRTIEDVIAINYAFAVNADVVLVPSLDRRELGTLPRQLEEWSNDRSSKAFDQPRRQITERINGIDFLVYSFATFFTIGLPYGLVVKDRVPCTHVLKNLTSGAFIVNNIVAEHDDLVRFDSAFIFSPQLFTSEETNDVARMLGASDYTVKLLLGENATVKHLTNYGGLFPFDVMHICSHGGETDGYYVTQDFTDRHGRTHKMEYYEIVGFSPAGGNKVTVESKAIFVALDGFPWMSESVKSYAKYVFEDMFKALMQQDGERVRKPVDKPIALSCHIQCYDSIHQGAFSALAAFGHPIIFNNTCSSSHELAAMFTGAGARSYIGTLWKVGNSTATQAAQVFYREALREGTVLAAFVSMSKSLTDLYHREVYIFWGLHFSSFPKPSEKSDRKIVGALTRVYSVLVKKIATTANVEVRRNTVRQAQFVRAELMKMFTRRRSDEFRSFDPDALRQFESALPSLPDDVDRSITEMTIRSEVRDLGRSANDNE